MTCSNCGKKIDENASFCPNCGKRISKKKNSTIFYFALLFIFACAIFQVQSIRDKESSKNTKITDNNTTKTLSYKIVNEGGSSKYIVIDSSFVNSNDLKKLGDKLKNDYSLQDPIQVYVFDDETVAKSWNSSITVGDAEKEKHFIALYWKAGTRHDLWVMPEGINGEHEIVTYEERNAKYYVTLSNVSVVMADGAFKITNKSGQNLTNVEMIINMNSSSKNQYKSKTEVIYNGNTFSAGMMTFANKDNELFNPFSMKVQSLTIYSDQGNLWVYSK